MCFHAVVEIEYNQAEIRILIKSIYYNNHHRFTSSESRRLLLDFCVCPWSIKCRRVVYDRLFDVSSRKELSKHGSANHVIAGRSSPSIRNKLPTVDPARTHVDLSHDEEKLTGTDKFIRKQRQINETRRLKRQNITNTRTHDKRQTYNRWAAMTFSHSRVCVVVNFDFFF